MTDHTPITVHLRTRDEADRFTAHITEPTTIRITDTNGTCLEITHMQAGTHWTPDMATLTLADDRFPLTVTTTNPTNTLTWSE